VLEDVVAIPRSHRGLDHAGGYPRPLLRATGAAASEQMMGGPLRERPVDAAQDDHGLERAPDINLRVVVAFPVDRACTRDEVGGGHPPRRARLGKLGRAARASTAQHVVVRQLLQFPWQGQMIGTACVVLFQSTRE